MSLTEGCRLSWHCGDMLEKTNTGQAYKRLWCISVSDSPEAKTSLMNSVWLWKVNKQTRSSSAYIITNWDSGMLANKQIRSPYLPDDVGVQSGKEGLIKLGLVTEAKKTKNKPLRKDTAGKMQTERTGGVTAQIYHTQTKMGNNLECGWSGKHHS